MVEPYYDKDGITIHCGDNCDVLGTFPRECIDLVVTSLPYGDLRTCGGHEWDFYGVAWQLKRVLKPGGVIVWVVNDETKDGGETGTSWRQSHHFQSIGLRIHDTMIYAKNGCAFPESNRYYPMFEYAFVFSNGKPNTFNPLKDRKNASPGVQKSRSERQPNGHIRRPDRTVVSELYGVRSNIWTYDTTPIPEVGKHPAPFPQKLAMDHIQSWCNEGDIVLDPFNGSGTTTKMTRMLGRKGIGIEINEEYCEIAAKPPPGVRKTDDLMRLLVQVPKAEVGKPKPKKRRKKEK